MQIKIIMGCGCKKIEDAINEVRDNMEDEYDIKSSLFNMCISFILNLILYIIIIFISPFLLVYIIVNKNKVVIRLDKFFKKL